MTGDLFPAPRDRGRHGCSAREALAERLRGLGCAVLRANTRGHDGVSTAVTPRGGRRLGAAYETIDDCRHDVAAWVDFLRQRGFSKGETAKVIETVLAEEGHPPASVFDFVQGITAVARSEPRQDARLELEMRAKRLMDKVAA